MFIFGGKGAIGESNALYCFNIGSCWFFVEEIPNNSSVQKVWHQVQTFGPQPPARYGHTATLVGNNMVVIGGRAGQTAFFNDVWVLDLSTCYI